MSKMINDDCDCPPLSGKFNINYENGDTGSVIISGDRMIVNPGTPHQSRGRLNETGECEYEYTVEGGNGGKLYCDDGVWRFEDEDLGHGTDRQGTLTPVGP